MRSSRRKAIFCLSVIVGAFVCWVVLQGPSKLITQRQGKFASLIRAKKFMESNKLPNQHEFDTTVDNTKKRKNIIIVAHGSSGSSVTAEMFSLHSSVFYLHEPLQTVERIHENKGKTSRVSYEELMKSVLKNIFTCNFTEEMSDDFQYYYHQFSPKASLSLASPPFCPHNTTDPRWDPTLCNMTSDMLKKVCQNDHKITVIKILISRFHGAQIKDIFDDCQSTNTECKLLFLVRDPRAIIASSRSRHFFKYDINDQERKGLRMFSNLKCQQTDDNLASAKSLLPSHRGSLLLYRYEDFAMDPLKALTKYYQFAGLPQQKSVEQWLMKSTQESKIKEMRNNCKIKGNDGKYHEVCNVDDAAQAVNRWRWKVPLVDINIMEEYCQRTMHDLGYRPINGSRHLMSNISIPLCVENYIGKDGLDLN